jgi:hypothetical protein
VTVTYHVGDTRAVVAGIPDASVSLVASSPPFVALRSYLPDGHPDKHAEIGSEPDPATFLDTLLALTAEWGRVLAPWGSIAIELGDTYAGSTGGGGDYQLREVDGRATRRESFVANGVQPNTAPRRDGWPRAKSLALIPQLYATSLAYGRNLLTGQPSPAGQWLVRNVIVWHRPNPAVGALGDKVRPSTSYITVATRSPKRWFDLDAVRQPHGEHALRYPRSMRANDKGMTVRGETPFTNDGNPAGAPPLDCWFDHHDTWTITTQPSSLAHYAMWPARLAERLILMMCPAEVCAACGTPRRRLTGPAEYVKPSGRLHSFHGDAFIGDLTLGNRRAVTGADNGNMTRQTPTLGWSDCGHNDYRPGVVLDPFVGTGTTLAVADLHGRDAIGIDLDERNRDLYPRRRDECARALFDVRPQMAGQLGLFG